MIDTDKYENMRQLFLDFIADPMCEEDETAWKRHLNTYDELLAEVKRLREALTTLLNDCEMILDGDDMSGMSDQQLFGAMKSTILSGLGMSA